MIYDIIFIYIYTCTYKPITQYRFKYKGRTFEVFPQKYSGHQAEKLV